MGKKIFVFFFLFLSPFIFSTLALAGELIQQTGTANPFDGVDVGDFSSPALGDIDGDGDPDAIIGNEEGFLFVYLNNGDGTFSSQTGTDNPFNGVDLGRQSKPFLSDFSGSDHVDLFVGTEEGVIHFFENESTAGSLSFIDYGNSETASQNPFSAFNASSSLTFLKPALVDIDMDDDLEAFVADGFGFVDFFQLSGNQFSLDNSNSPLPFGGQLSSAALRPAFSDYNDDNLKDILFGTAVTGGSNGDVELYLNQGTSTAPAFSTSALSTIISGSDIPTQDTDLPATPFGSSDPSPADFDGDGDDDFFVGAGDGTIYFFLNGIPPIDGDYNGDGVVDISDPIIALKITAGISPEDTLRLENKISGEGSGLGIPDAIFALQKVAEVRAP
jgi:hypothetical protein